MIISFQNAIIPLSSSMCRTFFNFFLLGTREELLVGPPPEKIKFLEDMSENEIAQAIELPG